MIGVSAEEYHSKIGNIEIAAIAGTVMVRCVVTDVLYILCLHDHCSVPTSPRKRTEGCGRNTDHPTLPA